MHDRREFRVTETEPIARLIGDHGFGLLTTSGPDGLVATHLPFLVERPDPLVLLGHFARANPQAAVVSGHPALAAFLGPHGYITPSWYGGGPYVPTWNYVAVHVHGVPVEIVDAEEHFAVLERTVAHNEAGFERPWQLETALDYAKRIAPHTIAFRLEATRVEAAFKLSQDKPPEVRARVIAALDAGGEGANAALAEEMRRQS